MLDRIGTDAASDVALIGTGVAGSPSQRRNDDASTMNTPESSLQFRPIARRVALADRI